jgi:CRISPR-associated protein Csb3
VTHIDVTGSIQRPLTHMALFGLAAILDDAGLPDVRTCFTDEITPRAHLTAKVDEPGVLASAVLDHAHAHTHDSWVVATMTHEGDTGKGVMSPRLKPPSSPESWLHLQGLRHAQLTRLTDQRLTLDLRMVGGLGEPAYWRCTERSVQPDQGASRWEMKARNRGEEFVANRLAPLARAVSARTPESLLEGLTGAAINDYTSAADSRSATGFAPPGPVDTAVVWCALWGLADLPVVHDGTNRSRTPGAQRWERVHPHIMVLPVFTLPTTSARLRAVLRSAELDRVATSMVEEVPTTVSSPWLTEHEVRALVRFDVNVVGSASAPERRILDGIVVPLE